MSASNDAGESGQTAKNPAGVIDTFGLGFALLNRRPYLIWVPVVLDVLLWLVGRAITITPMSIIGGRLDEEWGLYERTGNVELMNVMSALVPTFLSHPVVDSDAVRIGERHLTLNGVDGLLFLLAASAVAILAAALHLTLVGRLVNDAPAATGTLLRDCLSTGVRAIGLFVVASVLLLFMMVPVGLVAGGLWVLGVDPATLIVLSALLLGGWLGLFLVFSIPALALGYRRIFPAIRSSYRVVQHHAFSVIGLLAVALVIHAGLPYALAVFTESRWSVPFAIIVHGYVVTGLLASIMLFFYHRDSGNNPIRIGLAPAASS